MVSAATRHQVWNQLIDVWHYARYFNDLSEKKTKANRYIDNPIYAEVVPRELYYATQARLVQEVAWYVRPDGTWT